MTMSPERAARALSRVQLGELSAARQALEGAAVAPGTLATLAALTNPEKRPPVPRQPISPQLDSDAFLVCLRNPGEAQQQDHLFPVLESEADSQLFAQVGVLLATGNVPAPILEGIRLGRMTALKKPDGGVRVMADFGQSDFGQPSLASPFW